MKLAIISDTHDNIENISRVLSWIKKQGIETVLHCGDVCAPITLVKSILDHFEGTLHLVFGNIDGDRFLMLKKVSEMGRKNVFLHGELAEIEIDGKKIAMNHYPDIAKRLAESGAYDLVCFGHNHTQSLATVGKTSLVNPGNVAGIFGEAACATYDTTSGTVELYRLDSLS